MYIKNLKSINNPSLLQTGFSAFDVKRQFERELEAKYSSRFSIETNNFQKITPRHFRILQRIAFNYGTAALVKSKDNWYPFLVNVTARDMLFRPSKGIIFSPALLTVEGEHKPFFEKSNNAHKIIDLTKNDVLILEYRDFEPVKYESFQGVSGIDYIAPFTKQIVNISKELHLMVKQSRGVVLANLDRQTVENINNNIRDKEEDELIVPMTDVGAITDELNPTKSKLDVGDIKPLSNDFKPEIYMNLLREQKDFALQSLGIRKEIHFKKERLVTGEVDAENEISRLSEKQQEYQILTFIEEAKTKIGADFKLISNVDNMATGDENEPIPEEQNNE